MRQAAVLVLLASSLLANGGPTIVFAGGASPSTPTNVNSIPFNPGISYDGIRYQTYIPASMLPSVPALLTEVAYLPAANGTLTTGTFILSVGHAPAAPTLDDPVQEDQFD